MALRLARLAPFMIVLGACQSQTVVESPGSPGIGEVTFPAIVGRFPRKSDLLFVINNSPSMATKQAVLAKHYAAMMRFLRNLESGLLDLHIGVVSSDLGVGSQEWGEDRLKALGDRGLLWGNDPSPGAVATVAGSPSNGCGLDPGARWIEDIQRADGSGRRKNYTGELTDVFTCLALGVGFAGSPYPHPLQALRMAVNPQQGVNEANLGFLRSNGHLYIVIISDEDDCSAEPIGSPEHTPNNDGIFTHSLPTETPRLRCAGRGHVCNGQPIPNYDPDTGYDGSKGPLSLNLADCSAKDPTDPPDYHWLPLIPVQTFIGDILQTKSGNRDKIIVSGIIGWPNNPNPSGFKYQIDKNPVTSLWDMGPVCSRAEGQTADDDTYKAYPGLRLKKFSDAFKYGERSNVFSLCNRDFTHAMTSFGFVPVSRYRPLCVTYPLIDIDPSTEPIEPSCLVMDQVPCNSPNLGNCLSRGFQEMPLAQCRNTEGKALDPETAKTDNSSIPDDTRPCWTLAYDPDKWGGCPNSYKNQRILVLRKAGHLAPVDAMTWVTCSACLREDGRCPQ